MKRLKNFVKKNIHPFFIWKLEFSEVFKNNGGFSIVIGNPPYIQLQNKEKIPLETQKEYERVGFQTFTKRGDIYCLFYEFGNQLLKNNGHLVYITSNKWMRAGYGEKLRKYLSENTSPKLLIDLGSGIFKTATVDTNILLFQKGKIDVSCVACDIKKNLTKENIRLEDYIKNNIIRLDKFSSNAWIILNPIEQKIKEKIEKIGVPLKDWEVKINYGIKTGFNEAFIIDEKKKNELIANDPRSAEIIKPIIRGKDIKRYYTKFANKWIIIAKHDSHKFLEKKYPIIYNHLSKYKEELKKRGQCMNKDGEGQHHWLELDNNPNDDYLNQFDNGKVVYSEIVREPQFCFDINKYYPEATSFLMTGPNLKFLVSILNSKCFTYFFDRFYAGGGLGDTGYRYKKQFLELTPIPKISTEEQKPYIDLVDRILKITLQKNYDFMKPPQDQKELEKKIDEMVYKLYKIKDLEEIKLIENSSKR